MLPLPWVWPPLMAALQGGCCNHGYLHLCCPSQRQLRCVARRSLQRRRQPSPQVLVRSLQLRCPVGSVCPQQRSGAALAWRAQLVRSEHL